MRRAQFIYNNGLVLDYACEGHILINTMVEDARRSMPEGATAFAIKVGSVMTSDQRIKD